MIVDETKDLKIRIREVKTLQESDEDGPSLIITTHEFPADPFLPSLEIIQYLGCEVSDSAAASVGMCICCILLVNLISSWITHA